VKTAPIRAQLSKVAVCDRVGLCDEKLSLQLFCNDALQLNNIVNESVRAIQSDINTGYFYAAGLDEFMKACGAKDEGRVFKLPEREPLLPLPDR